MPLARHAVVGSQGLALPSRSTPTTASPDIFWQSKPHSKIGKQCKHRSLGRASHNPPGKLNGQYRHGERTKAAIAAADIQRIAEIAPHWPDVNTHEVLGWCMLACAHPADRVDSPFVGGARRSTNGWALLLCEATAKAD